MGQAPTEQPSSTQNAYQASVVIPTLNEASNIDELLGRVLKTIEADPLSIEVIVVDGNSSDGTQDKVRSWYGKGPITLVQSDASGGLAGDVLYGAAQASGDIIVILDADLSHPPEIIRDLIKPIADKQADMVVGSRYVKGGGIAGWPWHRLFTSKAATALAWPVVDVNDPMSGLFAVKKDKLLDLGAGAKGFKIGLEVLARGGDELTVTEVPFTFSDRQHGTSKFGSKEIAIYCGQLLSFVTGPITAGVTWRLLAAGLAGTVLDLVLFYLLLFAGLGVTAAHLASFAAAIGLTSMLLGKLSIIGRNGTESRLFFACKLVSVFGLAAAMRSIVATGFIDTFSWPAGVAIVPALFAGALVYSVGLLGFLLKRETPRSEFFSWRVLAVCLIAYSLVMRIFAGAFSDIIHEEAYYWMYAQHLNIGYLDHPPMVAWLIALSTSLFGNSELAVRLPAFACWIVAAVFMYKLTLRFFDKTAAIRTVLLLAVLPIYFSTGQLMTPDAPLYACWAGSLFFLERVLVGKKKWAWLGVGICAGLGMLSKYTMALIAPATLVYLLVDRDSRRWLISPQLYMAVILAAVIFSPVLIWNAQHDWASFAFQGSRRWAAEPEFGLHLLLGSAMVLLTPVGLIGIFNSLLSKGAGEPGPKKTGRLGHRKLFALIFTLVPLSVFVYYSISHEPKLNWTGPLWLSGLGLLAWGIGSHSNETVSKFTRFGRRQWKPNLVLTMLVISCGMSAIAANVIPGVSNRDLPIAWEELGNEVHKIEQLVTDQTGQEPIIVGMNHYPLSSEMAFYDGGDGDGPEDTFGQHLLGRGALMWAQWGDRESVRGKNIILVGWEAKNLTKPGFDKYFARLGEINKLPIYKNQRLSGEVFWRVGYDYRWVDKSSRKRK